MGEAFSAQFIRGIDANRTLKDELTAAVRSQSARRRIAVTDLVNLRQAFFRWTHPEIQPSPDRIQMMLSGTGFHAIFGQALSTEEFVEQFVEFEGIVGKIDIYEDIPVELKTTSTLPDALSAARPSYIDQLGMYCTMAGRSSGRLFIYRRELFGRAPEFRAFRVEFRSLEGIRSEMLRRRDLFQRALDSKDPTPLVRCEWYERNCDYLQICRCEDAEQGTRMVPGTEFLIERDITLEKTLSEQLNIEPYRPADFRLNDLVFPRKAAYEHRQTDEEEEKEEAFETRLRDLEREGFRGQLYKALRFGIPGAFKNLPVKIRSLTGRVGTYKDVPTLLRSTRVTKFIDRDRLPEERSWYFDRLAFECALLGLDRGRLVLYYEAMPDDKFMAYDINYKDLPAVLAEADRRLTLLETGADPHLLPACPPWMSKMCSFKDRCGCGDVAQSD